MSLNFGVGGITRIVINPSRPVIKVKPSRGKLLVAPVRGARGLRGPAGDETGLGYRHTQSQPAMVVQAQHGFPYRPAGIICTESDGYQLDYDTVSHPAPGITEITFGVPFSGTVDLS